MKTDERGGMRILYADPDGPAVSTPEDALDLVGEAWGAGAQVIALPVERLDPAFFDLSSRVAGEFTQKLVNYRLRLVVIGDISAYVEASTALRDYVWESNRGEHVWFLPDTAALGARLSGAEGPGGTGPAS